LINAPVSGEGYNLETSKSLAMLENEVDRQAQLQGYVASFFVLAIASFMAIPIVFLIRRVDVKKRSKVKKSKEVRPIAIE
jgi:hypothetical protein